MCITENYALCCVSLSIYIGYVLPQKAVSINFFMLNIFSTTIEVHAVFLYLHRYYFFCTPQMVYNKLYEITTETLQKTKVNIQKNRAYLSRYKKANGKKLNFTNTFVIVPTTTKKPNHSLYNNVEESYGVYDDTTLRYVPFIDDKSKCITIKNFQDSTLLLNPLSFREQILKTYLHLLLRKCSYKKCQSININEKTTKKLTKLSKITGYTVKNLIKKYTANKRFLVIKKFFCNICLMFSCGRHYNKKFEIRKP